MSTPPGSTPDPQNQLPQQSEGGAPPPPPPGYDAPPAAGQAPPTDPAGPPPGQAAPPQQTQSTSPFAGVDANHAKAAFQGAHKFDLGIIAAGVLAFIFSFLPYYSWEIKGFPAFGDASVNAWHGFFGWFGALVALGAAVVVALHIMGVKLQVSPRLIALAAFGVATFCVLMALFIYPGGDCQGVQACEDAIDFGHGIGYWLSVLTVLGGLVLSFLRKDAND